MGMPMKLRLPIGTPTMGVTPRPILFLSTAASSQINRAHEELGSFTSRATAMYQVRPQVEK